MKKKVNFNINTWLPVIIFALIAVIFGIATGGQLYGATNLMNIFNQSVSTIIAGLGMIFVATMGSTDITCGAIVGVAGTLSCMAALNMPAMVMIPVSLGVGLIVGLVAGVVVAKFKVNSFMTTLALMMGLRAFVTLLLSNNAYLIPDSMRFIDNNVFKVIAVIILVAIIVYVFHYTRFGVYVRGIGENENAIRYAGVNVEKIKIIAFAISGLMAGLAALFTIARVGGTNSTIGQGFEMRVMMALYIGGIPVRGGSGSKIYKLLFGAPTIVMLENGLVLCGASGGTTQLIRGIVLLVAVWLSNYLAKKFVNVGVSAAQNQKKAAAAE